MDPCTLTVLVVSDPVFIDWLNVTVMSDAADTLNAFLAGDVDEIVGAAAHADAVNSTSSVNANEERSIVCIMVPPVKDL